MRQDKKAQGGKLTFILARGIGEAFIAKDVTDDGVRDFLTEDFPPAMSLDPGMTDRHNRVPCCPIRFPRRHVARPLPKPHARRLTELEMRPVETRGPRT